MPEWIASIDLQVVMLRDLPVFETVIPSKIFEFLGQERPVILAARGEIRRMIGEAGAALVIDPEAPDQLVSAIEEVMEQSRRSSGSRNRRTPLGRKRLHTRRSGAKDGDLSRARSRRIQREARSVQAWRSTSQSRIF